jgi:CO dehydrogenase maturation factor
MSQDEFISYRLSASVAEGDDFDLIAMGGPEGPGCYCFPNNVLKKHLQKLSKNYKTIVMDNEAGMEHISRGTTTENVDALFILTDTSLRSVRSAGRIVTLTNELKTPIRNSWVVVTRSKEGDIEALRTELDLVGIPLAGLIPEDRQLVQYELAGRALYTLPADSLSVMATNEILERTLGGM